VAAPEKNSETKRRNVNIENQRLPPGKRGCTPVYSGPAGGHDEGEEGKGRHGGQLGWGKERAKNNLKSSSFFISSNTRSRKRTEGGGGGREKEHENQEKGNRGQKAGPGSPKSRRERKV